MNATNLSALQMPDAVTVMVSTELLAQLDDVWSNPVQIQIVRTPGIGSGYEMTARPHVVDGKTSDGSHTFDELYRFRLLYNAALFNEWDGPAAGRADQQPLPGHGLGTVRHPRARGRSRLGWARHTRRRRPPRAAAQDQP